MTDVRVDQSLGLILAPGAPSVAVDQSLGLIIEQRLIPAIISNRVDQLLMLIIATTRAALVTLFGGDFQDARGNPLSYGYLEAIYVVNGANTDTRYRLALGYDGNLQSPITLATTDGTTNYYKLNLHRYDGAKAWNAQHTLTIPSTHASANIANLINLSP